MQISSKSETIDFHLYWKFLGPYREAILNVISQPILMKFGMFIVRDETNRCLKFQVNMTRGRDKAWSQRFTMLYNTKNSINCA